MAYNKMPVQFFNGFKVVRGSSVNKRAFLLDLRLFLIVWTTATLLVVHGFNLENRLPIIKRGLEGSYFGYSVAQHVIDLGDGSSPEKWILVGAPLGQNLQPRTNHSGALFKCPITVSSEDCEQVITDGRRSIEDEDIDQLAPPTLTEEIKNDQWLGVTVRSQGVGGKVLVCAHRYISKSGESLHGQGLCYVLENDLKYDDTYEPCKGRSVKNEHEEYGFCQAGTSGTLLEDGTMVLGTPGPYTWRGTIFTISVGGEYLRRDKNHYYSPHDDLTSPVDKYSYLGMAVTGGSYFGNRMSYAAGAPRSQDHGQVLIFSKGDSVATNSMNLSTTLNGEQIASSFGYELATADVNGDNKPDLLVGAPFFFTRDNGGAVYVYLNENYSLPRVATTRLLGKAESQFGIAIANMGDINKDGCEDIAIGAPYEGNGVVYIYLGSKSGLSTKPSQRITGEDMGVTLNTFGSSLSGGIDLDGNSYPDLLVGSYDSSAATILLARPITNIRTRVISTESESIDPLKTGCLYDDASNLTCFYFDACCAIKPVEVSSNIETLNLLLTIEAETFNNNKKFSRVFFGPSTKKKSHIVKREIAVPTTGEEVCQRQVVYVKEGTRDIQSHILFNLNYTFVEPPLKRSGLEGLNPILDQTQAVLEFKASFQKDCGTDGYCETQLETYADFDLPKQRDQYTLILGQTDDIKLNVTITNQEDSAYEAQVFVLHHPSVSYIAASKGSVICNTFNKSMVACTLGNPFKRDSVAQVTLRFDPSELVDSETKLVFQIFANSTSKQLRPRPDTKMLVNVIKRAELSIKGWARPEQSFYGGTPVGESAIKHLEDIGSRVEHVFQIYNDGPSKVQSMEVKILWPYQVGNDKPQGKWLLYLDGLPSTEGADGGECRVIPNSAVNPLNLSAAMTRSLNLEMEPDLYFRAPVHRGNSKTNPYAEDISSVAPEKLHTEKNSVSSVSEVVSKTSYSSSSSSSSSSSNSSSSSSSSLNRVRRDRAMIIRSEPLIENDGRKSDIVRMDCLKNTAKCVEIRCDIFNMHRKTEAYIKVRARLWNATLTADYPKVDSVIIVSRAQIIIPKDYNIQQNEADDIANIETRAYPELSPEDIDSGVPIWIIIVSVVVGILLLILLGYCLYRCGFFKRKRPDPTLSGNLEKKSGEAKPMLQSY